MRYLAIIATRDFANLWQGTARDFLELNISMRSLLIWKVSPAMAFTDYKDKIVAQIANKDDFELGVLFHQLNGELEAKELRNSLEKSLNGKLSFCEWYSSNKKDFWDEGDNNADLPYNNLKKAWKDNIGSKEGTFDAIWEYFSGDPKLEKLLQLFAGANPFSTANSQNKDLKSAKSALQSYVKEQYLKN